ncbi:hypothetical protein JCM11641_001984 [Rhodosporidiobolus odoratus]
MKRLFNKKKNNNTDTPYTDSPPQSATNGTSTPLEPPPSSSSHSPSPRPDPQQLRSHQSHTGHQQQIQYGPDGQAYMLVPVNPGAGLHLALPSGMMPAQGGGQVPRPPRVEDVGNAIGWCCAMPAFEWAYVLALADYLSQGTKKGPSEEAAKALRKEFKHATPTAQLRSIRLTFLLFTYSDIRFRKEVASKKFLSELSGLVEKKDTSIEVKEMVFRILSPLAFEYQNDPTLSSLSTTFTKLLPQLSTFPHTLPSSVTQPGGSPLSPDDPLLKPEALLSPNSTSRSGRSRSRDDRWMSGIEQLRDLRKMAVQGKGYAGMLTEAVLNKGMGEGLEGDEIIQEFYDQTLRASEALSQNLEWASVQAEQSRERVKAQASQQPTPAPETPAEGAPDGVTVTGLASNNPFAAVVGGKKESRVEEEKATEEEEILGVLLGASSEISDALSLCSSRLTSSRQTAQEDADLAAATERSKNDFKYDRFANVHSPAMHDRERSRDYGEGGSGNAGRPSPMPHGEGEGTEGYSVDGGAGEGEMRKVDKGKGRARESLNPYAEYLSSSPVEQDPLHQHQQQQQQQQPTAPGGTAPAADDPYGGLDTFASSLSFSSPPSQAPSSTNTNTNEFFNSASLAPRSLAAQHHFSSSNPYASIGASGSPPSTATASPFADPVPTFNLNSNARPDPNSLLNGPLGTSESAFLREFVPEEPSQKALGKLRRVSAREDAPDSQEQQDNLEKALKEKYHRQAEEERERRKVASAA